MWLEIVKTAPTVALATAAVIIAWQQYRLAKAKLNLDLFDRRFAVFKAANTIVKCIINK